MPPPLDEIAREVQRIYREAVDPLGERFAFEKRPSEGEIAGAPMVLLVGNHSSGKSTFINHLLGASVQKAGLAPTDDAFTVLAHGAREEELDGQSIAGNPDLPFEGLRSFGPGFLSHFRVKRGTHELLRTVRLIDTPGMIDAAKEESGRGYDFTGVVRWFAERADVVLVFFDPEKPGTTGETLQVFTKALRGLDHKILIAMNRVDQFRSLQDFARAYGALCWNLAKVIPRKDLPLIYTTFVPVDGVPPSTLPVGDFEKAREDLVREIRRAPERRADNMLTQVAEHVERLRLHAKAIDRVRRQRRAFALKVAALIAGIVVFGALAGTIAMQAGAVWYAWASVYAATALLGFGGVQVAKSMVRAEEKQLIGSLPGMLNDLCMRELLSRDHADDLRALWEQVHPRVKQALETLGVTGLPFLSRRELARLDRAVQKEIPDLRARLHGGGAPPIPRHG